jgi:hypothetical protein
VRFKDTRGLTVALISAALSVVALAQVNSPAIKNAYSMGEASASRMSIRSTYANDQQNPTMLASVAAVDESIQRHAQKLGISSQRVLTVLKGVTPTSPDANLLNSHAEAAIEAILNAHGSGDKVVRAYSLGWKVSAYLLTCKQVVFREQQVPGLAANFLGAYPAMVDQLKTGAAEFGVQVSSPHTGLSLADTCRELDTTVTSLNNSLQTH